MSLPNGLSVQSNQLFRVVGLSKINFHDVARHKVVNAVNVPWSGGIAPEDDLHRCKASKAVHVVVHLAHLVREDENIERCGGQNLW